MDQPVLPQPYRGRGHTGGGGVGTQVRNEVGVWKVPGLSPKRKEVLEGAGF